MNIPRRFVSATLIAAAAILLLLGTLCFSSLRHGYSQIANTISELGETGAPHAPLVAFGFFLPVGLLVWLALWLLRPSIPGRDVSLVFLPMFCLGTGYVVSAFFACDPGAPIWGSWRTLVHNVAGLVDYGGTAIGFLLIGRCLAREEANAQASAFEAGGLSVLVCLAALCAPAASPVRGAVQRVAELVQFTGVFCACLALPRIEQVSMRYELRHLATLIGLRAKRAR